MGPGSARSAFQGFRSLNELRLFSSSVPVKNADRVKLALTPYSSTQTAVLGPWGLRSELALNKV
jgi:hypothetical protein